MISMDTRINEPTEPEVGLFRAIIATAMDDACRIVKARNSRGLVEKSEARTWFEIGGKDFRMICEHAGLEPEWVLRQYRKRIAEHDQGTSEK